jgi:hypothetical protein
MPEDINPSVVPGVTPVATPPTVTVKAPAGVTPAVASLSLEEATKRIADLEHSNSNAKEELERHRKRVSAFEKQEKEAEAAKKAAEEAQLSEIERVKKQHADIQAQHEATLKELKETKVQHAVALEASAQGFIRPAIVSKLLDWSHIDYDESGNPTNISAMLELLKKNMPELVAQSAPSTPAAQPASKFRPQPATPEIPAMNPGRANISQPGALPPGKIPRLSDVWRKQ